MTDAQRGLFWRPNYFVTTNSLDKTQNRAPAAQNVVVRLRNGAARNFHTTSRRSLSAEKLLALAKDED